MSETLSIYAALERKFQIRLTEKQNFYTVLISVLSLLADKDGITADELNIRIDEEIKDLKERAIEISNGNEIFATESTETNYLFYNLLITQIEFELREPPYPRNL